MLITGLTLTICFFFLLGIQLCGIFYSCVKSINIEAEELKKIFEGLLKRVSMINNQLCLHYYPVHLVHFSCH